MKKFLAILAITAGLAVAAQAQNQLISTTPVYTNVTIKAADNTNGAVVIPAMDMSKVYGVRIVETGGYACKYQFGTGYSATNAYSGTLSNGIPLAANGSVTYSTAGTGAIPTFPLSMKTTTNGQASTAVIEILKRP